MISTDTKLDLVINSMSEDILKALEAAGTLPPNQWWVTPDVSTKGDVQNTLNDLITKTTNHDQLISSITTALEEANNTFLKLSGGTMSGDIKLESGKFIVDDKNYGLVGYYGEANVTFGNPYRGIDLRGNLDRPLYNGEALALYSDFPNNHVTTDTTQTITADKTFSGIVIVPDVTIS